MTSTQTFTYDGATVAQSFVVPWHVPGSLTFTMFGGTGGESGGSGDGGRRPGPPGKIAGHLTIAALTDLAVIVGGAPAQYAGPTVGVAGWLGGDGGGTGTGAGGSGGGATAILNGASIIAVAGGGGGSGWDDSNTAGSGGAGISDGTNGDGSGAFGHGGTLTGPGAGGTGASPGSGHNGGNGAGNGGGGGAGYYGGGGAGYSRNGGGGSSWADTAIVSSITVPWGTSVGFVTFTWEPADPPPTGGWSVGSIRWG